MQAIRAILAALVLVLSTAAAAGQPPATVAERSGFKATSTGEDVAAFLKELAAQSPRAKVGTLGKTNKGREIPLVFVADPPVATAAAAKASGKLVVLLVGNIHAGEVDGKEALLALARDIAMAEGHPLLKELVLAFVPNFNADGNERIGKETRPGQVGPEEGQGIRENAQGLDLNRDFVKLESPEVRALVRCMNECDPAIVLDAHTTNGSYHRYPLTYGGPKHPAGDAAIVSFVRDTMLPAIGEAVREEEGIATFFYGNFNRDHTAWEDYPAEPRFGAVYAGLRNRIPVLTESYSYATYEERVEAQAAFVRETLEYAAANRKKIEELIKKADEGTRKAGREPSPESTVALRVKMVAAPEKAKVLGYVEEERDGRRVRTDEHKEYEVDHFNRFEATHSVPRPFGYLLPADATGVIETLQRHGIEVEELREDIELDVEVYRIDSARHAEREFQGHRIATAEATARTEARRVAAGTVLVRTDQPLGTLAAYLLEPEAEDGLLAWNFFDAALAAGGEFPVTRIPAATPILSGAARPLAETREMNKRVTFEMLSGRRAPNFGGSPTSMRWLPGGTHFIQGKDGNAWKVEAERGRAEPMPEIGPVAAALEKIPSLTAEGAKSLAGRVDQSEAASLLEHENDLYYVKLDGSAARRLTSTPEREELATLSPDGKFAAFVRNNDLWVVDVETGTERALTTGGTDLLRNGKADWVYFEEIFGRNWRVYWWSPDSRRIAFMQVDSSPVGTFTIVNDVEDDQGIERTPFPKPGTPNPTAKLGFVGVEGGRVRWADLSGYDAGNFLITGVAWWPDSSAACAFVTNRIQTWMDVVRVGTNGGEPKRLLRETTGAWVEPPPRVHFLKDGSFLLASERDGWNHLYLHEKDGKVRHAVTSGEWEVRSIERVDEEKGWVYFEGMKDNPIGVNLYRARLDGSGEGAGIERLTNGIGSHRCSVSPDGALFVDEWSSFESPTRVELRSTDGGGLVRTLDTNPVHEIEEYQLGERRLVKVPLEGGGELDGSVLLPPGVDPGKKYPVWFMTYAGPHAPTVSDSWSGRAWDHALANEGFIVFRADPRSASGKGAKSAWLAYRQLGVPELADIEAAIKWLLAEHPYADAERVGMSGHSYGGFMTAYAMTHSELFAAGIAGAPVTDWRDYDSVYTERYMSTPGENPEGYEKSSVVAAAKNLHGRLLLVHGLMDDNVHAQNSVRLIRELQEANKAFEVMVYPESRHGIWGRHYQELQVEFIRRTLGGVREREPEEGSPEPVPEEAEAVLGP